MGRKESNQTKKIKKYVLTIFDLRSSIVLTFSIATYPVCEGGKENLSNASQGLLSVAKRSF